MKCWIVLLVRLALVGQSGCMTCAYFKSQPYPDAAVVVVVVVTLAIDAVLLYAAILIDDRGGLLSNRGDCGCGRGR